MDWEKGINSQRGYHKLHQCKDKLGEVGDELELAYKEIERLKQAFRKYGEHNFNCECHVKRYERDYEPGLCTCGFEQVLEERK